MPALKKSMVVSCLLVLLLVLMAGSQALAQKTPEVSEIFDVAKPATVMVVAVYHAVISVPANSHVPQAKVNELQQELVAKVRAGQLSADESALTAAALEAFIADPLYYLAPSQERETHEKYVSAQGSGFFVTPDGYVVTNAHVVDADEAELKRQFIVAVLQNLVDQTVRDIKQAFPEQVSADMIERLKAATVKWYVEYMALESIDREYLVMTGVAVPGKGAEKKGMKAELVRKGEQSASRDVAILKVEGKNFPTLPVGDDSSLKTGDPIYCIGYPAAATFMPWADESATIEATSTQGSMSARKKWSGGIDVIQTDAAITHGNSGGPALDKHGNVIGLTTWGSTSEQQTAGGDVVTTEIQGMNFLLPAGIVKQYLDREGVKPQSSPVTDLYRKAIRKMNQQHYKSAMKVLQEINALAPGSPYVETYISDAQKGITEGKDKSWQEWLPKLIIAIVIVVLIVGAVVVVGVSKRKGAAGKAYAPPATPAQPTLPPSPPAPRVVSSAPAPPTVGLPPPPPPAQVAPAAPPPPPSAAPAAPPNAPPQVGATDAAGADREIE